MGGLLEKWAKEGERIAKRTQGQKEYREFQAQFNKEMKEIKEKLKKLPLDAFPIDRQEEALRKAGQPLLAAARAKAPVMRDRKKAVIVYSDGRRYEYLPGNLRISIQEIQFKRRRRAKTGKAGIRQGGILYFGPRVAKRRSAGGYVYGKTPAKADAFYCHMVEFGTRNMDKQPYMRPAFDATKGTMMNIVRFEVQKMLDEWARMNRVTP